MLKQIILTAAALAGVAIFAIPASAKDRQKTSQTSCPDMPTTNDLEFGREGGISLQVAGFGITGNRSRTRSVKDIMMREGGQEGWSAAIILAYGCQAFREQFPHDRPRQLDEMLKLRGKLLSPRAIEPQEPSKAPAPSELVQTINRNDTHVPEPKKHSVSKAPSPDRAEPVPANENYIDLSVHSVPTSSTICAGNACLQSNQTVSFQMMPSTQVVTCLPMILSSGGQMVAPSFCSTSGGFTTSMQSSSGQTTIFGNW